MQALIILDDQGNKYLLSEGPKWTIGPKEQSPSIPLQSLSAEDGIINIERQESGYILSASAAIIPVLVNGEKLSEPYTLAEGDLIQMGNAKLSISFDTSSDESSEEEDLLSAYDEIGHEADQYETTPVKEDVIPEEEAAQEEELSSTEELPQETEQKKEVEEEPSPVAETSEEEESQEESSEEDEVPNTEEENPEETHQEEIAATPSMEKESPIEKETTTNEEKSSEEKSTPQETEQPEKEGSIPDHKCGSGRKGEVEETGDVYSPLSGTCDLEIEYAFEEEERWLLKVLSGPNKGAEFPMKNGTSSTIGHDPESCDMIIFDLSVSAKHVTVELDSDNKVFITDLGSKNGTYVGNSKIEGKTEIQSHQVFTIGTSTILVLDKEAQSKTIVADIPDYVKEKEDKEKEEQKLADEAKKKAAADEEKKRLLAKEAKKKKTKTAMLIFSTVAVLFLLFVGFGTKALFSGKEISLTPPDQVSIIKQSLRQFPSVEFFYNKTTGKIFVLGHLSSQLEESQLLYELDNLPFIQEISNKVIIDENIWTEQNALLGANPKFEGVSMHAPRPGLFVINGYVKTVADNDALINFLNLHFPYLDLLENRVIVIEELNKQIVSFLLQDSLNGITFQLDYGDVTLFGFAQDNQRAKLQKVSQKILALKGVRFIKNLVVFMSKDSSAVNISDKYKVTGYSKHGNTSVNVVINGQIYARGDQLDGMTITGIRPDKIFLEKNNVKYLIDYHFSPTQPQ